MDDDTRGRLTDFLASPLAAFRPWVTPDGRSPQRDFMQAAGTNKVRIFRASNRAGKTTIGAYDHIMLALGMHPYAKIPAINHGWILTLDWDTGVGGIVWPKMKEFLPMHTVRSIGWVRRSAPEVPRQIVFKNGSTITFRSAEQGREKMQGVKIHWCWTDEEIDGEVVQEARARLIDYRGMFSATLTPVSRMPWVMDLESESYHGIPLAKVVRASMLDVADAGILDKREVEIYLNSLPERQRRVRGYGDFAVMEGSVYPEYSRAMHCLRPNGSTLVDSKGGFAAPWPLPESWPRFAAMDFGFSVPSCVLVIAEDPYTTRWFVERCYYAANVRMTQWVPMLKKELPTLECPIVTDHDAMERAELAAGGVPTCMARKDKTPGIEAVQRALMPNLDGKPRLYFVLHPDAEAPTHPLTGRIDCHYLDWEIARYRYPEKKEKGNDAKDEPIKRDDHACFVAGTLVETDHGPSRIDDLALSTSFVARSLDPATGAWCESTAYAYLTQRDASLVRVTWDGGETTCTPDHPFLTTVGWKRADELAGLSVLCDTMGDHGRPHSYLGDDSGVRRTPLLPVRQLFHGHGRRPGAETATPGSVDLECRADPTGLRHSPQEPEPIGQLAGEPGVPTRRRACVGAHDARAPGSSGQANRGTSGTGSPRLACYAGGAGVALSERQGDVAQPLTGRDVVRGVRQEVHEPRAGASAVLRWDLPGDSASAPEGGETRDGSAAHGSQVWLADPKGRLHELALAEAGALSVARRRVIAVEPAGRGAVYGISVDRTRNYVADGAVVANCDALRYLVYFLERRGLGGAPGLPIVPPKDNPFGDLTPPSPWRK